jgi:hypothetical protein
MFWCKQSHKFSNNKIGVTMHLKEKYVSFMFGVHCVAHKTILVVQMLFQLTLVSKLNCYSN